MNLIKNTKKTGGRDRPPYFFNTMLHYLCLCLFLSLVSLSINLFVKDCFAQAAQDTMIDERIVTGTGEIINKNVALARNTAISQAFLKAVEEYVIHRLKLQDMASSFQRLDEEILSKTKEEIQDYQIISEFSTDRYVRILMKVRVNKAILERKLKKIELRTLDARQIDVLFLVSEKREGSSAIYWWGDPTNQTSLTQTELFLSQTFENRGFRVINRSFFPPEESYDEGMLHFNLTDEAAVKWGRLLSAQVVIAGETNLYSKSKASVFFKAIKVIDGTVVAQGYRERTLNGGITDDQSAIELAISSWANDMISYIIDAAQPTQESLNPIIIIIKGFKEFRDFLNFKEFLKTNFPEIKSVLERRLEKGLVKLFVELKGDPKGFAVKVLNHSKSGLSFEINELSEQGFTLVIR
ncbi:MAG: hypothetical protein DRP14_03630 [Candidatus Aenigmatarchaeota archaeon]|nr:MAG: hypothetical protein DRP14_03630 [Candidatus Aenigmarchaeota archaeon]